MIADVWAAGCAVEDARARLLEGDEVEAGRRLQEAAELLTWASSEPHGFVGAKNVTACDVFGTSLQA